MWYWCTVKGFAPWEHNIGHEVYPEDKAAIQKMDEYHADKQKMESKKNANKSAGRKGKK